MGLKESSNANTASNHPLVVELYPDQNGIRLNDTPALHINQMFVWQTLNLLLSPAKKEKFTPLSELEKVVRPMSALDLAIIKRFLLVSGLYQPADLINKRFDDPPPGVYILGLKEPYYFTHGVNTSIVYPATLETDYRRIYQDSLAYFQVQSSLPDEYNPRPFLINHSPIIAQPTSLATNPAKPIEQHNNGLVLSSSTDDVREVADTVQVATDVTHTDRSEADPQDFTSVFFRRRIRDRGVTRKNIDHSEAEYLSAFRGIRTTVNGQPVVDMPDYHARSGVHTAKAVQDRTPNHCEAKNSKPAKEGAEPLMFPRRYWARALADLAISLRDPQQRRHLDNNSFRWLVKKESVPAYMLPNYNNYYDDYQKDYVLTPAQTAEFNLKFVKAAISAYTAIHANPSDFSESRVKRMTEGYPEGQFTKDLCSHFLLPYSDNPTVSAVIIDFLSRVNNIS